MGSTQNVTMRYSIGVLLGVLAGISLLMVFTPSSYADIAKAYEHEYQVMDKFHKSFDVYTDLNAGGNHFYPTGFMGDTDAVIMDDGWTQDPNSGTTCIKIIYPGGGERWAGVYWQEPENNWGNIPSAGYDIRGATQLEFWARGNVGGERIEFFAGGIGGAYPDSMGKVSTRIVTLSTEWKPYAITVASQDLSYVIGGFGWVANMDNNPNGVTFFLDDIRYNKARLDDARFLGSYEVISAEEPDAQITNAAYTQDNALVLLSFLARNDPNDLIRAKLLADAFISAQQHDRFYQGYLLRNSYMSGDLIDHLNGNARLPGWWNTVAQEWFEDDFQISVHTGNSAWVSIALLSLFRQTEEVKYLQAAEELGELIHTNTLDEICGGGYTGGYQGPEPDSVKIAWKSTEHNITLYVVFIRLYEITCEDKWRERALHARDFVDSMWDDEEGHLWAVTLEDGCTPNRDIVAIDVHALACMAFGRSQSSSFSWVVGNYSTEIDGFKGFDANRDRDGIWFQGTAQMAIAYQVDGQTEKSDIYISELRKAQASGTNTNGKGIISAYPDGITTGFDWQYFSRVHIGTTAWYIFAELGYNPYWGTDSSTSPVLAGDVNGDRNINLVDISIFVSNWAQSDCGVCGGSDFTFDKTVDLLDFAQLAENWLTEPCSN